VCGYVGVWGCVGEGAAGKEEWEVGEWGEGWEVDCANKGEEGGCWHPAAHVGSCQPQHHKGAKTRSGRWCTCDRRNPCGCQHSDCCCVCLERTGSWLRDRSLRQSTRLGPAPTHCHHYQPAHKLTHSHPTMLSPPQSRTQSRPKSNDTCHIQQIETMPHHRQAQALTHKRWLLTTNKNLAKLTETRQLLQDMMMLAGLHAHNTISHTFRTTPDNTKCAAGRGAGKGSEELVVNRPTAHYDSKLLRLLLCGLACSCVASQLLCTWTPVGRPPPNGHAQVQGHRQATLHSSSHLVTMRCLLIQH
jgi:hypothetical protein